MLQRIIFLLVFLFGSALSLNAEIHAVVFDFGGVIAKADRGPVSKYFMDTLKLSNEDLSAVTKELQAYVSSGGTDEGFWRDYARCKNVELANDWFDQLREVTKASIVSIPGTLALVNELKDLGYRTAMLSDAQEQQASIVRELGYYSYFDPVLLSYQTGVEKPDPKAFKILIEALALPPNEVIFVDDKLENVVAANAQGIHGILFENSDQLRGDLTELGIQWNKE